MFKMLKFSMHIVKWTESNWEISSSQTASPLSHLRVKGWGQNAKKNLHETSFIRCVKFIFEQKKNHFFA